MKENDNNFTDLIRLLALKRHETPPPGFYNRLSGEVIARIREGRNAQGDAAGRWLDEAPWLLRILETLQGKPLFAGSFASALFLVIVLGVAYAEHGESTALPLMQLSAGTTPFTTTTASDLSHAADSGALAINNSTNPVLSVQAAPSLFDQIPYSSQPASFTPNGQ